MMRQVLARWRRDERGVSAVEFAMLLPLMLAVLLGTFTLFDLFRTAQSAEKATFSVGDMLSRQTVISENLLNSMLTFIGHTVEFDGAPRLRVSSISNVAGTLTLDWSKTVGNNALVIEPIDYGIVPTIAAGDSVILTEAFIPHRAFVPGFGLDHIVYRDKAAHRPRFVGRIAYQ